MASVILTQAVDGPLQHGNLSILTKQLCNLIPFLDFEQ